MKTVPKNRITREEIQRWNLSDEGERLYPQDAVIDAYLKGKKDGLDAHQKALQELFGKNYMMSHEHTSELITKLGEFEINPISAHLKIDSLFVFEVIVLLKEDDFLSNKMQAVYSWCSEKQHKENGELYKIWFHFIDVMPEFDFNQLSADGFRFKHNYFLEKEAKKR